MPALLPPCRPPLPQQPVLLLLVVLLPLLLLLGLLLLLLLGSCQRSQGEVLRLLLSLLLHAWHSLCTQRSQHGLQAGRHTALE